ncbi:MAG: dihydroorotase [Thermotogae bacterium]|nr:dihydroorotase [Thermotogota bacterium]
MRTLIKGGQLISHSYEGKYDILISNGRIEKIAKSISSDGKYTEIDVSNCLVFPGFIDMHTHLREPGYEYRETLNTGLKAALHGGVTTLACMPNTLPPIDNKANVSFLLGKSKRLDLADLLVIGAITKGREGKELANMGEMKMAGAIAFSDDGSPVTDSHVMRRAMEYAKALGLPIISHCETLELSNGGHMREGWFSTYFGIHPIPDVAESIMVGRDIELSYLTGEHLHVAHVSTKRSVSLIRQAKRDGIPITCEVTFNHLLFTDEALSDYDTNKKVNPPLPTRKDQEALYEALEDGTIDILVTDHAPYAPHEKEVEFQHSPFGISGLDLFTNMLFKVHRRLGIEMKKLVEAATFIPARLYHLEDRGDIKERDLADLVIFDPEQTWKCLPETLYSKGKNTPFVGKEIKGKVITTLKEGKIVYDAEKG